MTTLFRGDASPRPRRLEGAITLPLLPGAGILAAVTAGACLLGLIFVSVVRLPETEVLAGALTPQGGLVEVVAQQGGEVVELRRQEGDMVVAGDVIAVMTLSPHLPDGDSGVMVRESFAREEAAAQAEARNRRTALLHEAGGLRDRRLSIEQELAETRNQLRISTEQWELARSELARSEELAARGYLTRRDLDARRVSALSAEARHSQMLNVVHTLEREASETASRISAIPIELATLDAETSGRAAQFAQRQSEAAAHNGYLVVAPISGRIVSSPVGEGNAAEGGQTVAVIVPEGARLEAEVYLPLRAMGRVQVGQPVRIKYPAYPFQSFGAAEGRIRQISTTAISTDGRLDGAESQPRYRAMVELARTTVATPLGERDLLPDMKLEAEVTIGRHTLLERLFRPLLAR